MAIFTLTMNPTIDINARVKQVVPEKKLRCSDARYEPGGGGINVSRAVSKLGGTSMSLFLSGGSNGEFLRELLEKESVENNPIPIEGSTRENFIVLEESSDQQFRFGMPGPKVEENEWQNCLVEVEKVLTKSDYLVASGSLPAGVPADFYGRVADIGKKSGARVIVDSTGNALCAAVERGVFMIKPNMRELREISGRSIEKESHIENVARQIIENEQCEVLIVSLGAGGAFFVSDELHEHLRSPTVPIKSKVGAGDSMVAGIVYSLSEGKSLIKSAQFGVAAGAAAVMTPGTELCRKEDTEKLFKRMLKSNQLSL
ncbi:MAG: 1-phosphofructokinase family hexose kinase [candidate division KSB1 bacterium]|jgi:6-phosphofructokinase 2|nr:1-phosphofructokinase family hexose kinase [candidate division KSB1 bacterium]